MFCWGSTVNGELGLGGIEEELILAPQELKFEKARDIAQVACGENHTLMVTTRGKVYSCGSNDHSQLGHTKSNKKLGLIEDLDAFQIVHASCGINFSVVLDKWGRLFAFGENSRGQLGVGENHSTQSKPKIVKGLATSGAKVVQIATGREHCLALSTNGELYSWGSNTNGQLATGSSSHSEDNPHLINTLNGLPVAFIACGGYHCFVVSKSGAVFGWGKNSFGQLGLNDNADKHYPNQLKTLRNVKVKYISCGEDFSVFLTKDGGVFTCGAGMYGQLGHGSINNESLPRKVLELMGSVVTQIACGRRHTLAYVPSRGRIYAFGLGGAGQLGTRVAINSTTPVVVLGPWVSPSGVCIIEHMPAGSTTLNIVKNIFAGGDHCFAGATCYLDHLHPDDYRVHDPSTQILEIALNHMNDCKKVKPNGGIADMELVEYLELTFSSLCSMNASFLLPNDQHYVCSAKNHGIDYENAVKCFHTLGEVQNAAVQELVLTMMVCTLQTLVASPPDLEALRYYLLVPLYHEFDNPSKWEDLQHPFGRSLLCLKPEAKQVIFDKWLSHYVPNDFIERLIRVYKNIVRHILLEITRQGPTSDGCHPNMITSLQLLDRLNKMNKALDEPKVPYNSFYIPELSDHVDVSADYVRWVFFKDNANYPGKMWFCNFPFLFDAQCKTILLETDASMQMRSAMSQAASQALTSILFNPVAAFVTAFLELNVNRETLVQDAIREIGRCNASDFKKPLKIKFFGEEAEDAGGVRKEFFLLLMNEILDPKYGMFRQYEETNNIWFSEDSLEDGTMYYLIGVLCGLAIYNFTIINLPFPLVLYKKLLKERVSLQDLKGLSPRLVKSFQDLLDYTEPDLTETFALTFEVSRDVYGEVKTIPLKEGGAAIPVTQENKEEFINLYVDLLLNRAVETQFVSFNRGFHKVCGGRCLDLFHSHELMALVVGNENYDWHMFEQTAEYKGTYNSKDKTIKWFWEVFHELSLEEKKKFLLYLTGTDRVPIQGMKAIKITIQPTNDDKYLPVAHTCFNLLDLPKYKTKEKLRFKLLQAIQQTLGFSLV